MSKKNIDSTIAIAQSLRNERGELIYRPDALLAMAGYGRLAVEWEHSGGLIYLISLGRRHPNVGPFNEVKVRREANKIIQKARTWVNQNLRAFKRHVKLTELEAVMLWKFSTHEKFEIVRCKVGDTVVVARAGFSTFGSGGSWSQFELFGQVTEEVLGQHVTTFFTQEKVLVTFDQGPAAIYVAAGDAIGSGRVFHRKLYVAE
ncbi:MAG: hypothetical protein M3Q81_00330 [bacterium]|nr:hypothetical protein [bacterium]